MGFTAPASRNAACPCGSGQRYKECHGALAASSAAAVGAHPRAALHALLQEALALQQAGDFAAAVQRYERVLAQEPRHFDALHMLGVVRFQQNELEPALALLEAAVGIEPDMPAAQVNRKLVRDALRLRGAEIELCRAVLPRLTPLCARADHAIDARLPLDLLIADRPPDDALVERVMAAWPGPVRVQRAPPFTAGAAAPSRSATVEWSAACASMVALLGLDEPLALWGAPPPGLSRMLVVTRDAPDLVHDRLRELSAQGREPVHMRYLDEATAHAIGLPGTLLASSSPPS